MNRNWLRSSIAMLMIAAPLGAIAQEPPVADPVENLFVPGDIVIPTPVIAPAFDPTVETFALASGDIVTWRPAEPTSPSDSLNSPNQTTPTTWTTQAAAPAARDGFEERIARLEAQVAALSQQLRSGGALAAPRAATFRTMNVDPTFLATQIAPATPTPPAAVNVLTSRNPAATATFGPGAPIVIHVYVHPGPAPSVAAPSVFRYQVAPAIAPPAATTPAPTRVRARLAVPAPSVDPTAAPKAFFVPLTPSVPAVPATPANPAAPTTPAPPGLQSIPAVPVPPSAPAALPVLPTPPIAPSATTESPALAPASRLAWDDVPGEK